MPLTLADHIVTRLKARGVRRMFGVPGGGSSLALIEAGARHGVEFVLARSETAAAIMAAVTWELTGAPGVVLTGIGPGAASVVNGIAYASLERSALILFTDCLNASSSIHQCFDQQALFAPLARQTTRLSPDNAAAIDGLLDACLRPLAGPVHVDLSAADANAAIAAIPTSSGQAPQAVPATDDLLAKARELLEAARRPVLLAGLETRSPAGQQAVRELARRLNCPVLPTYKAKGVFPDADPLSAGLFTNAAAEAAILSAADLIICLGLDPVEMIPQTWRYEAPVLDLAFSPGHFFPFDPAFSLVTTPQQVMAELLHSTRKSEWTMEAIADGRHAMQQALAMPQSGLNAQTITEALQRVAPPGTRLAVDAGAHMFAAMGFWQADGYASVLKSNGLSTMGYALPAAIASSLEEPDRPVLAITGDGGMNMCLAELATAAAHELKIVCAVLNDAALSLIDIKQQRDQRRPLGTRYAASNYARIAEGFGVKAFRVASLDELGSAARAAHAHAGPVLINIETDPSGYGEQLARLRG
jgi:acetolactate synthase-1/2/3 large subunit